MNVNKMNLEEFAEYIIEKTNELTKPVYGTVRGSVFGKLFSDDLEKIDKLKTKLKSEIDRGFVTKDDIWNFLTSLPYYVKQEIWPIYIRNINNLQESKSSNKSSNKFELKTKKTSANSSNLLYNHGYSGTRRLYTHELPNYPYKSENVADLLEEVETVRYYMKLGYRTPEDIEWQQYLDSLSTKPKVVKQTRKTKPVIECPVKQLKKSTQEIIFDVKTNNYIR